MFALPTQPSSIVLEIANVHTILHMKQDDDDTDREISENESENPGESTLSADIEEDDLDNQQEVLHLDHAHIDETIQTTRVPLPTKRSRADTVIARTSLPHLWHPAGAIAPQFLKRQKSTINILRESDVVPAQELPLPEADGDQNVPQPTAGGDHNISHHQNGTYEVAKRFMKEIVFSWTPWPIISAEKYSMVDKAWKLAIEAQHRLRALAGAPAGTLSVCQLPSGRSLKIDQWTREAVTDYSAFYSWIGLMMILNPRNIRS